jgi:hypothetical protein
MMMNLNFLKPKEILARSLDQLAEAFSHQSNMRIYIKYFT